MLKPHPQFIRKNGRKEFVVLPYDEFAEMQDLLQDAFDIRELRRARKADTSKPSLSVAETRRRLSLR